MRKTDPKAPTAEERKEHELTHLPFRSWCRHCIRERGKEEKCPRKVRDENGIPEVHLDYMFMGDEQEERTLALLVARERDSKATLATVVPRTGIDGWIPRLLMAWLRKIGLEFHDIIVKSDNEPALARERARRLLNIAPCAAARAMGSWKRLYMTSRG